ncbi:MAG: hypothetical protein WC291_09320 [Thermodesulfovibrionales bacterium]|jgi:hypothetical protein
MRYGFERLFDIEISHFYHSSGLNEDFAIEPAAETARLMKDQRLLFRRSPKGCTVLYEAFKGQDNKTHPVAPLDGELRLSFCLRPTTPFLVSYSDLPLESTQGRIYRMSNLISNQKNGLLLLTSDTVGGFLSNDDLIDLRPLSFMQSFSSAGAFGSVEVVDEGGRTVQKETVPAVEGICSCAVRLSEPGRYLLKTDGVQKLKFYASNELSAQAGFGVIDIFISNAVPPAYRCTDSLHDATHRTYTVRLDRRRPYWRYYVVLKYRTGVAPEDLSIAFPDPGVSFSRLAPVVLAEGMQAVPFVSTKEIGLHDSPVKGIQLKKVSGSSPGVFEIDGLPNGSYRAITPSPEEGRVYSEIFVYI